MGFWSFMVLELEWWIDGWMDHTDHMDGYDYQSSCGAKKTPYGDDFNRFFDVIPPRKRFQGSCFLSAARLPLSAIGFSGVKRGEFLERLDIFSFAT